MRRGSILAAAALAAAFAQEPVFKAGTSEVVLDLVVRDKRGHTVSDLSPAEIEIRDQGKPVNLSSFSYRGSGLSEAGRARAANPQAALPAGDRPRLVVLAFDRLELASRPLARQAGLELVRRIEGTGIRLAIVALDPRMRVLTGFTNDADELAAAVELVTSATATNFSGDGDPVAILNAEGQAPGSSGLPSGESNAQNASSQGAAFAAAAMQQAIQRMASAQEEFSRQYQGTSSINAMLAMVEGLKMIGGRKSVLYFSDGLQVPQNVQPLFEALIGLANRSNVTFYAVDARGLVITPQGEANAQSLPINSRRYRGGSLLNRGPVVDEDTRIESMRRNVQAHIQTLALDTGGFLVSDTNDLRAPVIRVVEETTAYYEASYVPPGTLMDGSWRAIEVRVKRPGVSVQSRSGYFALPAGLGAVMPFEIPLLRWLEKSPPPRDFGFHAALFAYGKESNGRVRHGLELEVPFAEVSSVEVKQEKKRQVHLTAVVMVKDATGRVVEKLVRDVPLEAPEQRWKEFLAGSFLYTGHFALRPGRYTLECAVMDRVSGKLSGRKSVVVVSGASALPALSDIAVVRRVDPDQEVAGMDPFRFEGGRVVPWLDPEIVPAPGAAIGLYFHIFTSLDTTASPTLLIEIARQGEIVASARPSPGEPPSGGAIKYLASIDSSKLAAGDYDVRVVVAQDGKSAERMTRFTVK